MSDKVDIPMDKVGAKTLNIIAAFHWGGKVLIGLAISAIALFGAWSSHDSASDSKKVLVAMIEEKGSINEQLRQKTSDIEALKGELVSVQNLLKHKDKEIADLQDEVEMLREELKQERSKFQAREAELIERISALKLKDGNPNSFE